MIFGGAIDSEMYVMNADGSDLQQITGNSVEDHDPAWSPDGTRIAFVRDARIHTIAPDGTDLSPVSPEGKLAFDPAWSPNGRRLAFVMRGSDAAIQEDLFTVRPDGTDLRRIGATTRTEADPAWSPDGQWIVYVLTHYHEEADTQDDLIVKIRWNGEDRTRLSSGSTTRRRPGLALPLYSV